MAEPLSVPDGWPFLTGWEITAAQNVVRWIDERLPADWQRHHDADGLWRWTRDDPYGWTAGVTVNARPDRFLVPVNGWPDPCGPTILSYARHGGPVWSVTLPHMTCGSEIRAAIDALVPHPEVAGG